MPRPKKIDKQRKEDVVPDLRQDREEFLRMFEKPTQIYRFLRARHCISPTFLHRSLLYMLKRNSRTHARRQKFKVGDMLEACITKQSTDKLLPQQQYDQLKILVLGFCIDPGVRSENNVGRKFSSLETQVSLRKTHRCRRKDGESSHTEELVGITDTPINPRNVDAYEEDPLYLSTTHMYQTGDGTSVKNYSLVFRVYESNDNESESESDFSDSDNSDNWSDGPGGRKRKRKEDDPAGISLKNLTTGTRRRRTIHDDDKQDDDDDEEPVNGSSKKFKKNHNEKSCTLTTNAVYEAELVMFNSEKQLLLSDGEYELSLTRTKSEGVGRKRNATWEALDGGRDIELLSTMNSAPVLKFKLCWSANEKPGPLSASENGDTKNATSDEPETKRMRRRPSVKTNAASETNGDTDKPNTLPVELVEYRKSKLQSATFPKGDRDEDSVMSEDKVLVYYQFIYNSETQQQTEAREDLFCPWCQLNCMTLYGLIKHLKLCHPRFNFTYSPQQHGSCIEVSVNECYDGSYCGNPQFIFAQPGMAFSRRGPVHRIEVTDTLVYRPRRERRCANLALAELLEKEENDASPTAHYTAGHHRLYFHSRNAVPIRPCEFEGDSEDEADPDWLRAYTKRMLDEFTDVNEGEKPVMKLWNLYIMKNWWGCIADAQLFSSCRTFLDLYGPLIARHSLRNNLLLHFVTLVDFGVLKASALISLMEHFDHVASTVTPISPKRELADDIAQADMELQLLPALPDQPRAGSRAKRVSVGDTKMGSMDFYEHNMSSQVDRLHAIINHAETKPQSQ
uniref:Polycomb protein suz12-A n=1 Tax=Phallusia mammillata TaxID=59560 RepID=A0A6F9DU99_9ASCI|nr:polycomb protein suz12-A [Phallusia mammillata]